jgi:hypothetical protein
MIALRIMLRKYESFSRGVFHNRYVTDALEEAQELDETIWTLNSIFCCCVLVLFRCNIYFSLTFFLSPLCRKFATEI